MKQQNDRVLRMSISMDRALRPVEEGVQIKKEKDEGDRQDKIVAGLMEEGNGGEEV